MTELEQDDKPTITVQVPRVTVIVPAYNRGHLIARTIRSVLSQTYHDFELIVVDDGSTDNTKEVVERFDDHRLRYIRHYENRGAAAARNTGIRAGTGNYIAFLDSDDEWFPTKLERQIGVFREGPPELGLVYTGAKMIDLVTGNLLETKHPQARGFVLDRLVKRNIVVGSASTALVRRRFLQKSGIFDEALPARQDTDLWIRLAKHCSFDYVDMVLVRIYVHSDRISEDPDARTEGATLVFEKIHDDLQDNRPLLAEARFFVAKEYCKAGKMAAGKQHILKAISTYPFRVKYYGALLATIVGRRCFQCARRAWGALKCSLVLREE